jgi:hypothetical protein
MDFNDSHSRQFASFADKISLNLCPSVFICGPGVFSLVQKSEVPKSVKKCQIIRLNVPPFYDYMVVGRIFNLRFTIYDLRVGSAVRMICGW